MTSCSSASLKSSGIRDAHAVLETAMKNADILDDAIVRGRV